MMWLVLLMIVICLVVVLRNRSHGEPAIDQNSDQHDSVLTSPLIDVNVVEEDLIAVITAAIQEFTGTGEFEVVKIKRSSENWTLTGRQNLVSNRW